MPELPSGLNFAITRDALFDHGGNWFNCPDGHFWFWVPAPVMGPPPYDINGEVETIAQHAPVPTNREEVKRFINVVEMNDAGLYSWGGEWLSLFPRYIDLDELDLAEWNVWISRPETIAFLDDTILECQRLAASSRRARGYAVVESAEKPDVDGVVSGYLRKTDKGH